MEIRIEQALDGSFTTLEGFGLIDFTGVWIAALRVAEGILADAVCDAFFFEEVSQDVSEGESAELFVSVGVGFLFDEVADDGIAVFVGDSFTDGDEGSAMFFDSFLYILCKLFKIEDLFGDVDAMGASKSSSTSQEASVASHDDHQVDAWKGFIVAVEAHGGFRYEPCCRGESRRVVVLHEVVVDGLGDMKALHLVVGLFGCFQDQTDGFRRVVSTDVEKSSDVVLLKYVQNICTILGIGLVAGGSESTGRGFADAFESGFVDGVEFYKVLRNDAADPVARSDDFVALSLSFENGSDERLVDDGCGSASLGNENFHE